ncbi:MAG: hypothetical protein K1X54_06210 [Flavobacteriales bacterium]|nr:hypothetical protein [Flavobacteriales bacterium]
MTRSNIIHYIDNGMIRTIVTNMFSLRKEQNNEVLYTSDGNRIPLSDLISLNGHTWS